MIDYSVATNQRFIESYNTFLKSNNITQAMATGYATLGDKVFPINYDMFLNFLVTKLVTQVCYTNSFGDPLDFMYRNHGVEGAGATVEDKKTILKGANKDYTVVPFEVDITNPFIKHKRGISVVFHTVNKHEKITLTITHAQLQEAFLKPAGIARLVDAMIADVGVQWAAKHYIDKRNALSSVDYTTNVTFQDNEDFAIVLRDTIVDLKFFENCYKYNSSVLYSPTDWSNYRIIMSEKFRNRFDVQYLANLFNLSMADIQEKITYIDEFSDKTIVCGIYDVRGWFFSKTLDQVREQINGADLTNNYFYHRWRMHSVSPHYNAVVFRLADTNIQEGWTEIVDAPNDVAPTITRQFDKTVVYTTDGSEPSNTNGTFLPANTDISITNSTVIKIKTVASGSDLATAVFVPNSLRVVRIRYEYSYNKDAQGVNI